MGLSDDAIKLHKEWQGFKSGLGAEMIKTTKLKFSGGMGPAIETMAKKWGTSDGQKAADKVKKVAADYQKLVANVKAAADPKAQIGRGEAWKAQKDKAATILSGIITVATKHKIAPPKK